MRNFNFAAMQSEWISCFLVKNGTDITTQQKCLENPPCYDDYDNWNDYNLATKKFEWSYSYKKVCLDGDKFQYWGVNPGWKLISPSSHRTKDYFTYYLLQFAKPIHLKNNVVGGIVGSYSKDIRKTITIKHETHIDASKIGSNITSTIPGYDITGKQFQWNNWNFMKNVFAKYYKDLNIRLQFRYGGKDWFLSGIQFDKVLWSTEDSTPIWIDF